jgi:hypothetical protein
MTVESQLRAAEERIWRALQAHDSTALERELDPGFVHSSPGSPDQNREAFLRGVREMPFRMLEIGCDDLRVRVLDGIAVVSGVQRARIAVDEAAVAVASAAFVDLFTRTGEEWRLRHAVSFDLPTSTE